MAKNLAILDFDRTLFDPTFYQAFIQALVHAGLLDTNTASRIQAIVDDPAQTIDLLAALRKCDVNIETAVEIAHTNLAQNQFLYSDVAEFLARLDKSQTKTIIMTTAPGQYWQRIKLSMCPALANFQQIMLSGNKGDYIKSSLTRKNHQLSLHDLPNDWFDGIMLIDDRIKALKPVMGESGFALWQVERPGAKYQRDHDYDGVHHVTTLNEVMLP